MKVLTIDLDYIMGPWIEVYQSYAPEPRDRLMAVQ